MSNSQFLDTNFNGGLQAPHYFNGRLLTAEDLQTDQAAVLTREGWLGKASGYGVIEGFIVSQVDNTSLKVQAGLGLNRQGQVISLASDTTLQLVLQATSTATGDDAGRFKDCDFSSAGGGTGGISDGAYLLTAIPASRFDGQVPMKAAAGSNAPAGCGSKWEVEGLQFKAIRLANFETEVTNITDNNRRNLLAHWCYGSKNLPGLAVDPFHFSASFGGLDKVDPADLTPCDLPLAVFYWQGGMLLFVDSWPARRRLIRPDAVDETQESVVGRSEFVLFGVARLLKTRTWEGILSDKRVADGQARFLQFQAQIDSLMAGGKVGQVDAESFFPLLPPAGFLPVSLTSLGEVFRRELNISSAPWSAVESLSLAMLRAQPASPPGVAGQPSSLQAEMLARTQRLSSVVAASVVSSFTAGTPVSTEFLALSNTTQVVSDQVKQLQDQIDVLDKQVKDLEARVAGGRPAAPARSKSSEKKLQRRERMLLQELAALMRPRLELQRGIRVFNDGFDLVQFFGNLPIHVGLVDRETVDFLIQRSWYDEAVDLSTASQSIHSIDEGIIVGGGTTGRSSRRNVVAPLFEVYVVLENLVSTQVQLYVLFTKFIRPTTWLHPFEKIRG